MNQDNNYNFDPMTGQPINQQPQQQPVQTAPAQPAEAAPAQDPTTKLLETKRTISNVKKADSLVKRRTGLTNLKIQGANNTSISGEGFGTQILNQFTEQNPVANLMNSINNEKNNFMLFFFNNCIYLIG